MDSELKRVRFFIPIDEIHLAAGFMHPSFLFALWHVRMTQWQQRFGFFVKPIIVSAVAGAIIVPQLRLMPEELTVAGQFVGAKLFS